MEVSINDKWGTICDVHFGHIDAVVVCTQLGYSVRNPKVHNSTYFGQGTGLVHMMDLRCRRKHTHIGQCKSKRPIASSSCLTHEKDVGVTCIDGKGTIVYITEYIL